MFLVKKKKGVKNEKILTRIMHDQDFLRLAFVGNGLGQDWIWILPPK